MTTTKTALGGRTAYLLVSAMGMALAAAPEMGHAQDAQKAAESGSSDEIIVTATRREARLQDVPVAVTAVSGENLDKSNFREVTDIQYLAPNVTFSATNPVSNGGGYQIRGVGTQTFDSGVEQTVGLVVDGVVIGLSRDPGATGFSDIERVEVLRGPQGTLFGKNSSAGVIHIITKNPQLGKRSFDLDLSYAERNEQLARGTVNLPIGSTAALRVSGFHSARDGAIPNLLHDWRIGDRNNEGVRAKLLWEPTDNFSLLLSGAYQTGFARDAHTIESLGPGTTMFGALYNSQFARFPVKPGHGVYLSYQDGDWTADTKLWNGSLQADYKIGDHVLTSITAYRKLKTLQLSDIDAAPVDIFNHSDGGVDSNEFTQELRLTSPSDKRFEYVLGLYYYRTENAGFATQYGNVYGLFGRPAVVFGGRRDVTNRVRSAAAFGNGTFALTDTLKLLAGVRYTDERNRGTLTVTPLPFPVAPLTGPAIPYDGVVKANNVSGKVGIQFEPSRDFMAYATYSTGFKGPALDGTGGRITEIRPETVKSYEFGIKSSAFDRRLMLNATLYWSNFSDFQAQSFDANSTPPRVGLANAGLLRARGIELESSLRVGSVLRLSASGAYNDSTFRDFTGPCYPGQPVSPVVGQGCYMVPATSLLVSNYHGYRLPNAPKWSYTLGANIEQPVSDELVIDAGTNWAWRSATLATLGDPKTRVDAYGLFNATLGIGADGGQWRVGLFVRNLFDKRFYAPYSSGTSIINPGGYFRIVSPEAFRSIGATASFKL